MKKIVAYITVAALVLVIAASLVVYAAPPETAPGPGGPRGQAVTLTDAQKQELAPLYDKMFETRKQITQKYVDWGYMTQEQADKRSAWMKERHDWHMKNGFGPGMGRGPGMMGKGPGGRGPCAQQQQAPQQAPAANQ